MKLTAEDYALLSKDAYNHRLVGEKPVLGDHAYTVMDTTGRDSRGFQATAYLLQGSSEVVIAFRGTEFGREPLRDGFADAAMVVSGINPQERAAEAFTQKVISESAHRTVGANGKAVHFSVTGHSLGGTLAELNGTRFGLEGHTFNAYGAAGLDPALDHRESHLINHVRAGDPVSAASHHLGEQRIYASRQDVDRISAAGYGHDDPFTNLRMAFAVDITSHYVDTFAPDNASSAPVPGAEDRQRYSDNKAIIDNYRSDIYETRSHASAIWEGRHAALDAASHLAHDTSEVMLVAGVLPETSRHLVSPPTPASVALDKALHPALIDDPRHPDHALYEQARNGVHAVDARTGRTPDALSDNLSAALVVAARRQGLSQIDHVVMNDDFSRTYAVQGDLNSPFKRYADVSTESAIATSVQQSSKQLAVFEIGQAVAVTDLHRDPLPVAQAPQPGRQP